MRTDISRLVSPEFISFLKDRDASSSEEGKTYSILHREGDHHEVAKIHDEALMIINNEDKSLVEPDAIIATVVEIFSKEVHAIQKLFSTIILTPDTMGEEDLEILSIQIDNLEKLRIDGLSSDVAEKLDALKQEFQKLCNDLNHIESHRLSEAIRTNNLPLAVVALKNGADGKAVSKEFINQLFVYALETDDLDLAYWCLTKDCAKDILESPPDTVTMSEDSITWLKHVITAGAISPGTLDTFALDIGLGYKAANLMLMESALESVSSELEECHTEVPPFVSVGDLQMWKHIEKGIPELKDLWKKFTDSFDAASKEQFITAEGMDGAKVVPISISEEGEKILAEIQEKITAYFSGNTFSSLVVDDWLREHPTEFVIVRSTGREDSDTNANAGGNASIPFVRPNSKEVSGAIAEVVSSYFGGRSIIQRLQSGDQSIFTEKPFIPVLIQEMECEQSVGGTGSDTLDIPRSGVLFTAQQDKAEDVIVINAALGSNEGVVASQVVVDTYSVHPGGIHCVIRDKKSRFVHLPKEDGSTGFTVGPITNIEEGFRKAPALSRKMIKDLATLARNLGKFYGGGSVKPMDMEYTIKFKRVGGKLIPVIYPLQIRPLQNTGETTATRTFVDLKVLKEIPKTSRVSASTLLDGRSVMREVDNADEQVIFADDLPSALLKYQKTKDPSKIRLVLIKKPAPLTSHEAIVLRPTGIPVMVLENQQEFNKAKALLEQSTSERSLDREKGPCFICPQRGVIFHGKGKALSDVQLEGLISYPGPLEYTIPDPLPGELSFLHPGQTREAVVQILKHLETQSKAFFDTPELLPPEVKTALKRLTLRELFDKVAMGEKEEAKQALAYITMIMYENTILKNSGAISGGNIDTIRDKIRLYEHAFKVIQREILPAIEKHPPQSMNRLFYLKPLEAMIFQKSSPSILHAHSINTMLSMTKQTRRMESTFHSLGLLQTPRNMWLLAIGKQSFCSDLNAKWNKWITNLSDESRAVLVNNLKLLQELGIGDIFINLRFSAAIKAYPDDAEAVLLLLKAEIDEAKESFEWLKKQNILLNSLEQQTGNWSNPSYVKNNLAKLQSSLQKMGFLADSDMDKNAGPLHERYAGTKCPLGKLATLAFARRVIACYDNSIKSLSGSSSYPSMQAKALDFSQMLIPYQGMMTTMLKCMLGDDGKKPLEHYGGDKLTFTEYCKTLVDGGSTVVEEGGAFIDVKSRGFSKIRASLQKKELSEEECKKEFLSRSNFNVAALVIGTPINRGEHVLWPNHLEEYFTTFHQTMETALKHENTRLGLDLSIVPKTLQDICRSFEDALQETKYLEKVEVSSIHKEGTCLEVTYNIPLAQHAARVSFYIDTHFPEKGLEMKIEGFGANEQMRWTRVAAIGSLIAHRLNFPFVNGVAPKIDSSGIEFSLHIPHGKDTKDLLNIMKNLFGRTFFRDCTTSGDACAEEDFDKLAIRCADIVDLKDLAFHETFGKFLGMETIEDWKEVPGEFFAQSFYLNLYLLDHFTASRDYDMQLKIIRNSIKGLKSFGEKDYFPDTEIPFYESKFLPEEFPLPSSLVNGMKASIDFSLRDPGLTALQRAEMEGLLKQLNVMLEDLD
jgi:hypothetical protein